MKTKILYILHLILLYGCKINKEKSERIHTDNHSQGSLETSTSWRQFNSHDSSYRYWFYTGDSSFYFHPDAGLWSHSGQLIYGEKLAVQRQVTKIAHRYDSTKTENSKTENLIYNKTSRNPLWGCILILAMIPVAVLIYWWRRK